jgi:4-diphosphocytidyl-2C-methyl-D-erythritol kinase
MLDINELLDDIRKIRNDLVAQANPHFQTLTKLIYIWENKLLEDTPAYKQQKELEAKEEQLERFKQREQEERENLEKISKEAREEEKYLAHEQYLADWAESFKEKDEN